MQKITEHHYDNMERYNRKTTVLSIWNSIDPNRKWHFLLTPNEMERVEEETFWIDDFYKETTGFSLGYFTFNLREETLRFDENSWVEIGEQYKRCNPTSSEIVGQYPCWEFNDDVEIFFKPKQ